jgi:hypothetical protein
LPHSSKKQIRRFNIEEYLENMLHSITVDCSLDSPFSMSSGGGFIGLKYRVIITDLPSVFMTVGRNSLSGNFFTKTSDQSTILFSKSKFSIESYYWLENSFNQY